MLKRKNGLKDQGVTPELARKFALGCKKDKSLRIKGIKIVNKK